MSPEVFEGNYSNKCDVWSLGVLIYKMISGNFPFNGSSLKQIKNDIASRPLEFTDQIWSKTSPVLIDLLKRMLVVDPNKRISAGNVLKHKFFKKSIDDSVQFDTIHSTKNCLELSSKLIKRENKRSRYNELVDQDTKNIKDGNLLMVKDMINIRDPGFFTVADFKKNLDYKPTENAKLKI